MSFERKNSIFSERNLKLASKITFDNVLCINSSLFLVI